MVDLLVDLPACNQRWQWSIPHLEMIFPLKPPFIGGFSTATFDYQRVYSIIIPLKSSTIVSIYHYYTTIVSIYHYYTYPTRIYCISSFLVPLLPPKPLSAFQVSQDVGSHWRKLRAHHPALGGRGFHRIIWIQISIQISFIMFHPNLGKGERRCVKTGSPGEVWGLVFMVFKVRSFDPRTACTF